MITLTPEQCRAVSQHDSPHRVVDPDTQITYVLVREELYQRVQGLFSNDEDQPFLNDLLPSVMEVFGKAGWDDPAMDIYNDLDPRKTA